MPVKMVVLRLHRKLCIEPCWWERWHSAFVRTITYDITENTSACKMEFCSDMVTEVKASDLEAGTVRYLHRIRKVRGPTLV